MHNKNNEPCGCGHSNRTNSLGVINYSAKSINELLAIIPLKANRDEVPAPDEEDLAIEEGLLKLKDKKYNHYNYSGLGRCYLRKNMVDGVNVLTQEMFFNTDGSPKKNTRYIIQYDYVLNHATLQIPEGCELSFEGGSIKNGTIVLNETLVRPLGCRIGDYISAVIEGTYKKGQVLYSDEYEQSAVWTGDKWKYSYSTIFRNYENKLQYSVDEGKTWEYCSDYIAHYFRFYNNKIQISHDKLNWEDLSDEIAAYFRFQAISGGERPESVGKIQISRDNKTWTDLSPEFTNHLRIAGYVVEYANLPTDKPVGTIIGVGPTTDEKGNKLYRFYVYDGKSWVDNGSFTSIAAGIVQETGDSENVVMSQKAVTEKLSEINQELKSTVDISLLMNHFYNGGGRKVGDVYTDGLSASNGSACTSQSVKEGEVYTYNGRGSEYVRAYIITDENNIITRISSTNVNRTPTDIQIQSGESKLYVSFSGYDSSLDYLKLKRNLKDDVSVLAKNVEYLQENDRNTRKDIESIAPKVEVLDDTVNPKVDLKIGAYYKGHGYNIGDTFAAEYIEVAGIACKKQSVMKGERYLYHGQGSEYVRRYIIVDNNNVITRISTNYNIGLEEIVIEENEVFMYVAFNEYNGDTDYLRIVGGINKPLSEEVNLLKKSNEDLYNSFYPNIDVTLNQYYPAFGYNVGDILTSEKSPVDGGACTSIKVKAGEKYLYNGSGSPYVICYIITDSNRTIKRMSAASWGRLTEEITIQSGESQMYVNFNSYNSGTDYIKSASINSTGNLPFSGKNIVCFGDSITEFSSGDKRVTDYLAEYSGANVINVAVGGTRMAQRSSVIPSEPNTSWTAYGALDLTSMVNAVSTDDYSKLEYAANWLKTNEKDDNTEIVNRLKNIDWSNIDAVTILIGTNDYAGDTPIGSGEESVSTIKGSILYIANKLLSKYPHLSIYWFTPVPRWMATSLEGRTPENWGGNKKNSLDKTLVDYVDAIIEQCELLGIPVCDTYRTIGWTIYNLGEYLSSSGTDGVHPYRGFEKIAKRMLSFISANNVV